MMGTIHNLASRGTRAGTLDNRLSQGEYMIYIVSVMIVYNSIHPFCGMAAPKSRLFHIGL